MVKVKPRPKGLDSPLVPKIIKRMSRAQVWLYRRTNGRLGGTWRIGAALRKPVDTLLLDHRGRKSGTVFTIPLLYMPDGDNLVVVASQGGLPSHPQWYFNLRADPDTRVQVNGEVRAVRARTASGQERESLWRRLVEMYADFASYQSWTDREIPVVILEPRT
ncbi:nitroreductase family deazaflavin-dependent oxidoreductase [Haloechinothrix sp. YIM 98757]|uniref:Nitroreductase family deazaflavin-dependent oxidoreductase n=1 Tax=Haloechinothrix aidingensis TaxID=2752311 RepID=A0A838ACN4_9PSEU|nr:nitroreductase family deazaflavin-dependent oxidoreductase [Haloechinothrix aidingensis]MBA0126945.1 nitroreductase family deazaflavin-dependent oxidoreductase [Haloechinothrix aidingensis]